MLKLDNKCIYCGNEIKSRGNNRTCNKIECIKKRQDELLKKKKLYWKTYYKFYHKTLKILKSKHEEEFFMILHRLRLENENKD